MPTGTDIPLVVTNDTHYTEREDHRAHDVLLCIGLGKDRSDENRMRYDRGLYFKSPAEVAERFPDRPEVLENTVAIADSVFVCVDDEQELMEMRFANVQIVSGDPS